jgi:hypothetical protein
VVFFNLFRKILFFGEGVQWRRTKRLVAPRPSVTPGKKLFKKLSKTCQKVFKKFTKSCQKVVKKLSNIGQKVVKHLSKFLFILGMGPVEKKKKKQLKIGGGS